MNIYSKYDGGHRLSYVKIFEEEFNSKRKTLGDGFFSKDVLFFLMIEECFFTYFFVSILRSMFGYKTAGLLFRVLPTINSNSVKMQLKYHMLRFLKSLSKIHIVSIVPFYIDKKISRIADVWIYDPQLWDLSAEDISIFEKALNDANSVSYKDNNEYLISLIGSQNKLKGFSYLLENFRRFDKKFTFFFLGKLDTEMHDLINYKNLTKEINGVNRFVSDSEIITQYALSDYIWCFYDETYDQASGVFGRAIQLNRCPIIRKNTMIEKMCVKEGMPYAIFEERQGIITLKNFAAGDDFSASEWRYKAKKKSKLTIKDISFK